MSLDPTRVTFVAASAFAALAVATPAFAQCGYENGSPQCFSFAPPPSEVGNISENLILRSNELKISGDIRVRSRFADSPMDAPYNGSGDQIASRARVNLDYKVNEYAQAFVQLNFSETYAGSDPYSDAVPGETSNGVAQAYLLTENAFGAGETLRVGRSYFTLASGLVYGSCDYLQYPASATGLWVSKQFGKHAIELFGFDNNGTKTAAATGARFIGGTGRIDLGNEVVRALEPWALFGTGEGDVPNADEWYGLTVSGSIGGGGDQPSFFDWNAEVAQREVDATNESRTAYRAIISKDLTKQTDGWVESVHITRTDAEGAMHINPGDFNTAGLLHQYGGAWRSDLVTNQLGVGLKPHERVDLNLNYLNFDAAGDSNNELDAMLGTKLNSGLHAWLGYGIDEDERQVFFAQLTLYF